MEITSSEWNDEAENQGTADAAIPGTKQRSDKGMMAALAARYENDIATVTGSNENINALIIGCESANRSSSDYDYNDIVFLMVSNSAPTIQEKLERRYLCEDLGSTYDFDFNDIVVDVKQTQTVTSTFTETNPTTHTGTWTRKVSDKKQTVSIAHMCGTIPFQVYVGNEDKTKAAFCFAPMRNPNYNKSHEDVHFTPSNSSADYCISVDEKTIGDKSWWDPATNNIFIDVWQGGADPTDPNVAQGESYVHTVKFPKYDPGSWDETTGKNEGKNEKGFGTNAPQMIAVDPLVMWMKENKHIPTAWVNIAGSTLSITNETGTSSSSTTTTE